MEKNNVFTSVRPDVDLPGQEEAILQFWDDKKIFQESLKGEDKETFSFYDGPPFATGLPHYGHLLAGVIKDVVPRYWTMKGYRVPRRFGWDCHGLPVEYEINKTHKIESRKDVLKMGVKNYNNLCRSIVKRYSEEWKVSVRRVGRWVDMENPYFTMDLSFMQGIWWVFGELYKRGLIYEGYKVVPYSVGISTSLSNFEANLNYKMVQDPAVTISFKVDGEKDLYVLAWTTTPWTLPSNLALAVGIDIDYVQVLEKESGKSYILAKALLENFFKDDAIEVIRDFKGKNLIDKSYSPLFPFFADKKQKENAFRIIASGHVTTDSGTGIVHMAPAFGEDDFYACLAAGIHVVNPVDDDGVFTSEVGPYQGKKVKDADKDIIADLKKQGLIFKHDTINHSYPFCYRSETPLIYRAVSSWFVSVEKIKDDLLKTNAQTRWVPEHLRDGRFGKWLEGARDWSISRNRFWGTPIPIWRNTEGEVMCISSKEELERLTGEKITDLHMDFIDHLEIPSPTGLSNLKRISDVFDVWFESGSMPYAGMDGVKPGNQEFEKIFPADFIAEGLDQTRGWFYTLMVISTALFQKPAFKNVIVNGLVLAEDGRKMSKSLRNYPDPMEVLKKHGADALRLYLIDSPVVKAQELRFSEKGVFDIVRKILLRWWNSYAFFVNYASIDAFVPKGNADDSPNILDQWVLSRVHGLILNTQKEMDAYRLYNVVPQLLQFIEELTNTYIRFNRGHFWQEGEVATKTYAYETLYEVLMTLSKLMAPFAPFMAEVIYLNLSQVNKTLPKSVHLTEFPVPNERLLKPDLEEAVKAMDVLVALGRNIREKIGVKAKIPLKRVRIIHRSKKVLDTLRLFEPYFVEELNFRQVEYDEREDDFVQVSAKAHFPSLGKRLGAKMKAVAKKISELSLAEILRLEKGDVLNIEGEEIAIGDVEIRRSAKGDNPNISTHQIVSIEIDPSVDPDQLIEGLAREVMRKVQTSRKAADLKLDDRIELSIACGAEIKEAIFAHEKTLCQETLTVQLNVLAEGSVLNANFVEGHEIDNMKFQLGISKRERV